MIISLGYNSLDPSATLMYNCIGEIEQTHIYNNPKRAILAICLTCILVEMAIYAYIIRILHTQNKRIRPHLRVEAMIRRKKKNAIDMFGHICQFCLEIAFVLLFYLGSNYNDSFSFFPLVIFYFLQQAANSILHIAMSSDMKKELGDLSRRLGQVIRDSFSPNIITESSVSTQIATFKQ